MHTKPRRSIIGVLLGLLSVACVASGCSAGDDTTPSRPDTSAATATLRTGDAAPVPTDEQLTSTIKAWARGDDTGDGVLACSALTTERREEEREAAQEEGDLFDTCEEMYSDPPVYPKDDLIEYQVEQRDASVALVRAVFEGGSSSGSVHMFGLVPVSGTWLIADHELLSD